MSGTLREGVAALAARSRAEAEAADRKLPEFQALARAGAILAKRVPDQLLAEVRQAASAGVLEARLRELAGDAPSPAALAGACARMMEDLCERAGEALLGVTDASVRNAAALGARRDALLEKAAQLDALVAPEPEERPPDPAGPPPVSDPPGSQGAAPATEDEPHPDEGRGPERGTT